MTTQQPTAQRTLRRRSDDRVIGGVASGLGDYFNIDPLLIRIGFVGLMVFGGMGIFLYIAAWLLVPDETTGQSIAERFLRQSGLGASGLLVGGLAILALVVVAGLSISSDGAVVIGAIILIAFGARALVLRQGQPDAAAAAASVAAEPGDATATTTTVPPVPVLRRPPRPPSPLGWYATGMALVGVGILALGASAGYFEVDLGQYFGLALGVMGIALIIGTWWGHARGLILLGLLVAPIAYAASLVHVPLEGGFGSLHYGPATADEPLGEYRLVGGQITLDLTRLEAGPDPIAVAASVAFGDMLVIIPEDASVEIDAAVGGGRLRVLGTDQGGSDLEDRQVIDGRGPEIVLDLATGLGDLRVESRSVEDR